MRRLVSLVALTVTSLCASAALAQGLADGAYAVPIVGGDGLTLQFEGAQGRFEGDGVRLDGALVLDVAGLRTTLFDADVRATVDHRGHIDTLYGRARVAPDPSGALDHFDGLLVGEIGLAYGRDLHHLDAPLQPDTRYLVVHVEGGPRLELGVGEIGVSAGVTVVLDPHDPYLFVEGEIEGLGELTIVERVAIGVSAHGRIPLEATQTWGLAGMDTHMDGHLYIAGRVAIPKAPLTVEGELLVDVDVDDDGTTLFHGSPEMGFLFNGEAEIDLEIGPLLGVRLPIGAASAGGTVHGDDAGVWFSGVAGLDAHDVVPGLPFAMHGRGMAAGYLSTRIDDSFVVLGGDVQLADWHLFDGTLYVDPQGVDLVADLDLRLMTVTVRGRADAGGFALGGSASFSHAIRAPREVTEFVDVAVQYTANAAICGYEVVSDGAICGWEYVTDGAMCGYHVVTDGARCGWDTVWGWFCGWSGWCSRREPQTCDVDASCHIDAECEVPASCSRIEQRRETRIIPEFDFGRIEGELDVELVNDTLTASASAYYCDVVGNCFGVDTGDLRVSPGGIELCIDLPDAGHVCLDL